MSCRECIYFDETYEGRPFNNCWLQMACEQGIDKVTELSVERMDKGCPDFYERKEKGNGKV